MTANEAIRILHPDTSLEALDKIEYLAGFNGDKARIYACNEACIVACETILRQREELSQIEMRVLENFIHSMPKTYRKRNSNWGIVQDILQRSTSTAGMTSCIEKCRELGIDPDGHTLERVKDD